MKETIKTVGSNPTPSVSLCKQGLNSWNWQLFWQHVRKHQETGTKHDLANQHMMFAGFAIENLCKGYLAGLLSPKEQEAVKEGKLPKTLDTHDVLKLVRSTGMTFSDREKDLLIRIGDAIWRGRYPSPSRHTKISPSTQREDDVARINTFLPRLRAHVGAKNS